jgi:uncharacterized protein
MRINVSHLVKAPIGARDVVHLDTEAVTLDDDLALFFLRGDVSLTRTTDGLLAEGHLETALDIECARCLTLFTLPLTIELEDLTFALPQVSPKVSEYRISDSGWVNLVPALREQVLLNMPLNPLCRADCRGLCSQCGKDLNLGPCDCSDEDIDPRLAKLRDLL